MAAIKLGETRPIMVDTTSCGKPDAPCKVFAKGPHSPYEQLPTKKTKDGFECDYTPKESGPSSVKVEYSGKELPKSPYVVNVESDVDISKVAIKGLESRKLKLSKSGHDREWLFRVCNWLCMDLQKLSCEEFIN